MNEEMKKNFDDATLGKEQIEEAAGGTGWPWSERELPTKIITCPKCGQEIKVPLLVSPGSVIKCTKCGEEISGITLYGGNRTN